MDFPTDIRYEAFFIFLGLFAIGFPGWIYIFHPDKMDSISWFAIPLLTAGVVSLMHGVHQLINNYNRKQRVEVRRLAYEEWQYDEKLRNVPEKYKRLLKGYRRHIR